MDTVDPAYLCLLSKTVFPLDRLFEVDLHHVGTSEGVDAAKRAGETRGFFGGRERKQEQCIVHERPRCKASCAVQTIAYP